MKRTVDKPLTYPKSHMYSFFLSRTENMKTIYEIHFFFLTCWLLANEKTTHSLYCLLYCLFILFYFWSLQFLFFCFDFFFGVIGNFIFFPFTPVSHIYLCIVQVIYCVHTMCKNCDRCWGSPISSYGTETKSKLGKEGAQSSWLYSCPLRNLPTQSPLPALHIPLAWTPEILLCVRDSYSMPTTGAST